MTEALQLSCKVPRWFALARWAILLIATSALLQSPIHGGVKTLAIVSVVIASLFSWFRRTRWQFVDWAGNGALVLRNARGSVMEHASWTGHAWRSRWLCVVRVRTSSGIRHDLVLFSASQPSSDWRRLLVRLGTRAGQADTPRIVF